MGPQGVLAISLLVIILNLADAVYRGVVPSPEFCAFFPNEEFLIDLTKCQNTCEFYGRNWDCPDYYKPRGDCYCKDGFARIEEGGECVSVTENALCAASLPIQPDSCSGPNEIYKEKITTNVCDVSCSTFGCTGPNYTEDKEKWSPNCQCSVFFFRRLSNGTCVLTSDEQCMAEFQPSPERCAALGQIYQLNAPCQEACYSKQYCPPASGACVCPPGTIPHVYQQRYDYTLVNGSNTQYVTDPMEMISCYRPDSCPINQSGLFM